jgi:hypothetical protein
MFVQFHLVKHALRNIISRSNAQYKHALTALPHVLKEQNPEEITRKCIAFVSSDTLMHALLTALCVPSDLPRVLHNIKYGGWR